MRSDPIEELNEVYDEVKQMENKFKKCIDVCGIYNRANDFVQ